MNQVIIVGAGPTGVTLALVLLENGIKVKLIEASGSFSRTFRGEGLMPSGVDALAQMGLSSLLENIPHRSLDAWEFVIDRRTLFRVKEPIEPGSKPCTLVSQPAFLAAALDRAFTHSNFEFVPGPVKDLVWDDGRVSGVKLSDGRTFHADLAIGADGRNSSVRQQAHLVLKQRTGSFDILWFKLAGGPAFERENVFYSVLQGPHAFGLFRSAEGNLQLGWFLRKEDPIDWKQVDWPEMLQTASPPWLAAHFRSRAETIERPVLLSVAVGRCDRWHAPGVLLLGDAAHPMSPIRAQGINMGLRDVIVAANYLVPLLRDRAELAAIDRVLPRIQAEREPEIILAQRLQRQEAARAELLAKSGLLRWSVSNFAPMLAHPIRLTWVRSQRQLRQGLKPIKLIV